MKNWFEIKSAQMIFPLVNCKSQVIAIVVMLTLKGFYEINNSLFFGQLRLSGLDFFHTRVCNWNIEVV